jgi:hypothetical protein
MAQREPAPGAQRTRHDAMAAADIAEERAARK